MIAESLIKSKFIVKSDGSGSTVYSIDGFKNGEFIVSKNNGKDTTTVDKEYVVLMIKSDLWILTNSNKISKSGRIRTIGNSTLDEALFIAFQEGYYESNPKAASCRGMIIMSHIIKDEFNKNLVRIKNRINKELK